MRRAALLMCPLLLAAHLACLKPEPIRYRVRLGMCEAKLMEALGPPLAVREEEGGKTLEYRSWGKNMKGMPVHPEDWYVHLSHGQVDRYGVHEQLGHPVDPPAKQGG